MANEKEVAVVSLKGGAWRGLGQDSASDPNAGLFSTLQGVYLSRDGQELRTWPGSVVVGRPFLGYRMAIGGGTVLTGGEATVDVSSGNHLMKEDGAFLRRVYIKDNSTIPDGIYPADREDNNTIRIETALAPGAVAADGSVWVPRKQSVHGLYSVYRRPVVVAETQVFFSNGTDERRNIGCWVGSSALSITSPLGPGYHDSSTATTGFLLWISPTMQALSSDEGDADAWHMDILRRITGDVLNGRLCLAVPGHGHCWEVNLERDYLGITFQDFATVPEHRYTKLLGIPKGLLDADSGDLTASSVLFDPAWLAGGEHVWVAVGYMDPVTGEIGLRSQALKISNTDTAGAVRFPLVTVMLPRGVLKEAVGLALVIYASEVDGSPAAMFPTQMDGPFLHSADHSRIGSAEYTVQLYKEPDPGLPVGPRRLPSIEQMLPGASTIVVVKGRVFVAGDRPDSTRHAILTSRLTLGDEDDQDRVYDVVSFNDEDTGDAEGRRAAGHRVPQTYASSPLSNEGSVLALEPDSVNPPSPFDFGLQIGALMTARNQETSVVDWADRRSVWAFSQRVGSYAEDEFGNAWLFSRPNIVAYSEEGRPGISPAINRIPIDLPNGQRVIALGRAGEQLVVFSDTHTWLYEFGAAPRPAGGVLLSSQYGCIAPKSVVDGPFGLAWLSREGPCVMSQGVRCMGGRIRTLWDTLKRDSEGMMQHAQGTWDKERECVIWTLRGPDDDGEIWAGLTLDAQRAKVEQDLLLVWHPATDSLSTVERRRANNMATIASMPCDDGIDRVCWVSGGFDNDFSSIFALHDDYSERDQMAEYVIASDRASGDDRVELGATADEGPFRVGDDAFIRSPTGKLRWWGQIQSVQATSVDVTEEDGALWEAGDVFVAPVTFVTMVTNRLRVVKGGLKQFIDGINIRCHLRDSAGEHQAWAYVRVRIEDHEGRFVSLNSDASPWGEQLLDGITRFRKGRSAAHDSRIHIDVIANVQVRITDIEIETSA